MAGSLHRSRFQKRLHGFVGDEIFVHPVMYTVEKPLVFHLYSISKKYVKF